MKIWVYTLTYNNELILPHFLKHYEFAERIIAYDDGSTDDTWHKFKAEDYFRYHCTVNAPPNHIWRTYTELSGGEFREDIRANLKNQCWKEAKGQADWVIIVDPDEFIWHPDLFGYLKTCKENNINLIPTTGYEMSAAGLPETTVPTLTSIFKSGVRNDLYSKPAIFDPNLLDEINYVPGCHYAFPVGRGNTVGIQYWPSKPCKPYPSMILQQFFDASGQLLPERDIKLLHYRFMGKDHVHKLWEMYKPRMSEVNKANGWDRHCYLPIEEQHRVWHLLQHDAVVVIK